MSKKSYNAVMRELKKIKKQMEKEASHEKFKAMKAAAKNERAVSNLAKQKGSFDLYYGDKFDPINELGVEAKIGFSDNY